MKIDTIVNLIAAIATIGAPLLVLYFTNRHNLKILKINRHQDKINLVKSKIDLLKLSLNSFYTELEFSYKIDVQRLRYIESIIEEISFIVNDYFLKEANLYNSVSKIRAQINQIYIKKGPYVDIKKDQFVEILREINVLVSVMNQTVLNEEKKIYNK